VPRNAYRGTAAAFAFDREALALTVEGMQLAADAALDPIERIFFYLPLEHAESLEAQDAAVAAFARLTSEAPDELRGYCEYCGEFARKHRDVIVKFGRFPASQPRAGAREHRGRARVAGRRRRQLRAVATGGAGRHRLVGVVGFDEAPGDFGESGLDAALEAVDQFDRLFDADPGGHAHLDGQHHLRAELQVIALSSFSMPSVASMCSAMAFCRSSSAERPTMSPLMRTAMNSDTMMSTTPITMDPRRRRPGCR
jgi:hypothetical protein